MLASDAEPQQPGRKVGLAGDRGAAFDRRLDAAQARGVADDPHRPADGVGALGTAVDVEGHDGAEAGHEAAGGRVGRMVGAAGVAHDLHPLVPREVVGELRGRCARALQPQRERAHAADREVGLQRAGRGPGQLAPLAQPARGSSDAATAAPSSRSEWPPRYFVAECMTRSAPSSSGRWTSGVANVLSTTTSASGLRGAAQIAGRSATASSGLDGDSSHSRSASAASSSQRAVSSTPARTTRHRPCAAPAAASPATP